MGLGTIPFLQSVQLEIVTERAKPGLETVLTGAEHSWAKQGVGTF